MPTLLPRIEKSEIDEAESKAFHHRGGLRLLPCAIESADSVLRGERSRPILAEEGTSSGVIHDPRVGEAVYFWNKARADRVSCLVAQFAAIWCRSAHRESETWPKRA